MDEFFEHFDVTNPKIELVVFQLYNFYTKGIIVLQNGFQKYKKVIYIILVIVFILQIINF